MDQLVGGHLTAAGGLLVALSACLALVNGMHDASNAVSTSIVTRSLSERSALGMAAALNLLGALAGIGMIHWTLRGLIDLLGLTGPGATGATSALADLASAPGAHAAVVLLLVAALITIGWELLTWWRGMPSSTLHAFAGSLVGGALVLGPDIPWARGSLLVVLAIVLSPLLGGALTFVLVHVIARLTARRGLRTRHLRAAQTLSAGAVAAGHGMMDVRLPFALAVVGLTLGGSDPARSLGSGELLLPWWLILLLPLALAGGTLLAGRPLIRTLGRRLTDLSTAQGLAAETSAALILYVATLGIGIPVSTTHTMTAGIVGAGWAVGPRSVRWSVVAKILAVSIATPLVCAGAAALIALALSGL